MNFDNIPIGFAVIDFLCCLLLILFVWAHPKVEENKSSIETPGKYIIQITWPTGMDNDVDLWVQNPKGDKVWFADQDLGLMHLEHDDLGLYNDVGGTRIVVENTERVVIRGIFPGEYIVNVHLYKRNDIGPTPVTVELFRVVGQDKKIISKEVLLINQGDEKTAFRFTLNRNERVTDINELQTSLVYGIMPS